MANDIALRQITSGIYLPTNTMPNSGYQTALGQTTEIPAVELPSSSPDQDQVWEAGTYLLSQRGMIDIVAATKQEGMVYFTDPKIPGHPAPGVPYRTERSPIKPNVIRFFQNDTKTFGVDESIVSDLIEGGYMFKYEIPVAIPEKPKIPIPVPEPVKQIAEKMPPAVTVGLAAAAVYLLTRVMK